jgi:hypothetical protein
MLQIKKKMCCKKIAQKIKNKLFSIFFLNMDTKPALAKVEQL